MLHNSHLIQHRCVFCGETFWSKRPDAQYHAGRCKQAAYRWRKRLPIYLQQAKEEIDHIGSYLAYPDSREMGIHCLVELRQYLKDYMHAANIRSTK